MPRRISDYPDAFTGWNWISSSGSIVSLGAAALFLYILYDQLTRGEFVGRYPWLNPQFYTDTLQAYLNRSYPSLEWALSSPPKPHAFVSLPLQSQISSFIEITSKNLSKVKKHLTLPNIILALAMFVFCYILRTYVLNDLIFNLRLFDTSFTISIPKDFSVGCIGLFFRLGLKGVVDSVFEVPQKQELPLDMMMMSDPNNGGKGSSSNPNNGGEGSSSNPNPEANDPEPEKKVITDSDYEWDSDSEYEKERWREEDHTESGRPESDVNKLVYGTAEDLKKAPKKLLEDALDATKFICEDYKKRSAVNSNLVGPLKGMNKKYELILEELEKREIGEGEDKGKGKMEEKDKGK